MVKHYLKKKVLSFYKWFYLRKFINFLKSNDSKQHLYIFDLDNTIAHTFPELHNQDKQRMYKTILAHKPMLNLVKSVIKDKNPCIILTARAYKYKSVTSIWILENLAKDISLFMVPKAEDKLIYLQKACNHFAQVTYYDDMSYNHEYGEVKFYKNVINQINNLPLNYFGYDAINDINNSLNV